MSHSILINRDVMVSYRQSKIIHVSTDVKSKKVTSIDFDDSGTSLVTCDHEALNLYDIKNGKFQKTLFSKKYGAHFARFTHQSSNCIHASTRESDIIRYLSVHTNQYIRYFKGHKEKVTSLEVSPADDHFLSASLDGTVRIWDLSSSNCQGMLTIPSPSWLAFDPAGVVFAVACEQTAEILLYDLRNYDSEPFAVFKIEPLRGNGAVSWSKIEFSNDGKHILVATNGPSHYLLDAFSGEIIMKFSGHTVNKPTQPRVYESSGDCTLTPDSRFVVSGSTDKKVYIYDIQSPVRDNIQKPLVAIDSKKPISSLLFNPRLSMFATADHEVTFWLPNKDESKPRDS
ncbi:WD40-repeat-containing domain protein [Lipomyces japonicus]|uniref:WD40-repeat-containing domain protein n=1 Tax=Lipomyces japonicus TaxID=56871 RepID=UPI0034CF18FD